MRAALDATQAKGGGDSPEAVIETLQAALTELKWSPRKDVLKLVYLVGDAAPQERPGLPSLERLAEMALERGIVLHSIACGSMGRRGQRFFEAVARMSEGRPFRLAHRRARRGATPKMSDHGAAGTSSLASAVSGTARAYSTAVGVDFAGVEVSVTLSECEPVKDARLEREREHEARRLDEVCLQIGPAGDDAEAFARDGRRSRHGERRRSEARARRHRAAW